jgi:Protein of unknown function (DUF3551)
MSITFRNRASQAAIAARVAKSRHPQNWTETTIQGDYHLPFAKTGVRAEAKKCRIIFAPVVILAALVFGPQPAKAYETPWCAVISDGYWDCQYRSIEECRPNVLAGNRGFCNLNPRWTGWYEPAERRRWRY